MGKEKIKNKNNFLMDMMSTSTSPGAASGVAGVPTEIVRRSIEGTVLVRRKNLWVTRFASIKDSIFTYKKDRSKLFHFSILTIPFVLDDAKPRYMIDLRKAEIKKGMRSAGDRYLEISDKTKKDETVKVAFDDETMFKKWGMVFLESTRSDEELRQTQIVVPQKQQEEQKRIQDEQAEKEEIANKAREEALQMKKRQK